MGRSISPMEEEPVAGSDPSAAPRLIVPMSLQLVIPRRVALQQSSPALHQPSVSLKEKRKFEKEEPLNCRCANSKLSQQKGSPQKHVPEAGSYAPVTVLVDERGDGVHLSYDRMASLLAPYGSMDAIDVARDLDSKIESLLQSSISNLNPRQD